MDEEITEVELLKIALESCGKRLNTAVSTLDKAIQDKVRVKNDIKKIKDKLNELGITEF